MFQQIRTRLLLNSLWVFALVLAGFAIAVRLVFMQSLQQQMVEKLTAIGQSVVDDAELDDSGSLTIDDELLAQKIIDEHQSVEWFDLQGKPVEKIGDYFPDTPLNPQAVIEIQAKNPRIQFITLPVLKEGTKTQTGYVRVSQRLDEFDETVFQLDAGLGVGVIVAIVLSSAGILWLNRQAMQPIEESFRRLKEFTADASHELRSPLMAISSNVEVALKYPEGMRDEDREAMSAVLSATDQMTHLTEDLLLLARTDKVSALTLAPVNLSNILKDLVQLYRSQAEEKQIEITADVQPALRLQGDSAGLTRAFTNLVQNAIRYTSAGGKIDVKASRLGDQLQVRVTDTGVGIARENLEKVFERFWRADQARNYDAGGSGLGLSITQAIVRSHRGYLKVTSTVGRGSSFVVSLPVGSEA